jgi:DMSO/TMAO reductase YedYZ molybdopterin-dependent catalytic subunit
MANPISRRAVLAGGVAAGTLAALGLPDWVLPALAQGETLVPFTDIPENFSTNPTELVRVLDIRRIDGPVTPRDQFFTLQHYTQPDVDPASYRLSITGLVDRPLALPLDELRRLGAAELVAGFECSGNSPGRLQGLASNGRWTGVPLHTLLARAGVKADADEVVFFGADRGEEDVDFRGRSFKVVQQFGRSLSIADATKPEPFIAHALGGQPLSRQQGFPIRLVVPGWYGVANVKWLSEIHVQKGRYLGKYQARWYRTLRGETINGEVKWTETEISRQQLKSVIARVTRAAGSYRIVGFVLNDGTPLRSVEVRVDDGPWRPATLDAGNTRYSWKLFSCRWDDAQAGEHTLVSRVTDVNGRVQPTTADLESKLTMLENNAQWPRRLRLSTNADVAPTMPS